MYAAIYYTIPTPNGHHYMTTLESSPISRMQALAKASGYPEILRHSNEDKEVFLPSGSSMLCARVLTINRNKTLAVEPGAERKPAIAMLQRNHIGDGHYCQAWFVWKDGQLFGQFHNDAEMRQFAES